MELKRFGHPNDSAEEIWNKIKEDDPSLERITLIFSRRSASFKKYGIADTALAELGRDIGRNTKLSIVEFEGDTQSNGQDITDDTLERLRTICEGMNSNQSMKSVRFTNARGAFIACAARTLCHFLENNDKLERVFSSFCQFNEESSRQLAAPIARRKRPLLRFYLKDGCTMDINSFGEIIGAFLENPDRTPLRFDLSYDTLEVSMKLMKINELLEKPNCTMKTLMVPFDGAFKNISRSLCDVSSINATYYSNHTFERICYLPRAFDPHLGQSLKLNRNPDKKLVALQKVVMHHFGDQFQIEPFVGMPPDLSLRVMDFLDDAATRKDNEGNTIINIKSSTRLSILFQIVRDNPLVCAKGGEGKPLNGEMIGNAPQSKDVESECDPCKRQRLL